MDVIMEAVGTMDGAYVVEENGSGSDRDGESSSKDDGKGQDKEMTPRPKPNSYTNHGAYSYPP